MARIAIENYRPGTAATDEQCRCLETGDILFFPAIPFDFPVGRPANSCWASGKSAGQLHKNVSYRPAQDRLTGIDQGDEAARSRVHAIMQAFSQNAGRIHGGPACLATRQGGRSISPASARSKNKADRSRFARATT